jgi:hypothetical protein
MECRSPWGHHVNPCIVTQQLQLRQDCQHQMLGPQLAGTTRTTSATFPTLYALFPDGFQAFSKHTYSMTCCSFSRIPAHEHQPRACPLQVSATRATILRHPTGGWAYKLTAGDWQLWYHWKGPRPELQSPFTTGHLCQAHSQAR